MRVRRTRDKAPADFAAEREELRLQDMGL